MVYEPYQDQGNAAVQTGVWQDWDAYDGGAAKWWINTGAGGCGQNTPCSWSTIVAAFPRRDRRGGHRTAAPAESVALPGLARRQPGFVQLGHRLQRRRPVRVGRAATETTYDFELIKDLDGDGIPDTAPPTNKDQCKKNGWKSFNNPTFKNQGDCVSFVATGGKNGANG